VQAVEDVHDTACKTVTCAPAGLGVVLIVHSVPFQLSANVTNLPELFTAYPAATHEVDEMHDTPDNTLVVAPLGFGVDWTTHSVPFQRSASVTAVPELLT
jgi:hypothetical protein